MENFEHLLGVREKVLPVFLTEQELKQFTFQQLMRAALLLNLKPVSNTKASCIEAIIKHPFDDKEAVDLINLYRNQLSTFKSAELKQDLKPLKFSSITENTAKLLSKSNIELPLEEIESLLETANTKNFEKVLDHNVKAP